MVNEETTTHAKEFPTSNELQDVSPRELEEQIAKVDDLIEQEQRWQKYRRKAMDLEKLKLANRARRCCYCKANGQECRAPAWGSRLFCAFHARAMDENDAPRMKVQVLADRQSIQLTLQQIMEQLVSGRITPQVASGLLRAAYIALGTLKPKPIKARRAQAAQKRNAENKEKTVEHMTEEELDAEIEKLDAEINELKAVLAMAPEEPRKARGNPVQKSG